MEKVMWQSLFGNPLLLIKQLTFWYWCYEYKKGHANCRLHKNVTPLGQLNLMLLNLPTLHIKKYP
jgi:hypothetical protein